MEKFKDLQYVRPDIAALKKQIHTITGKLKKAASAQEAQDVIKEYDKLISEFETMLVIAHVRNTMNTNDEFYDNEMKFINESIPTLIPLQKKFIKVLLNTPWRPQLEKEIGVQYFKSTELQDRIQSSRLMLDMVKEAQLTTQYSKVTATCKTNFNGEECNFYGLLKYMENDDREVRKAAYEAWAKLYENVAPQLDEIYGKLVDVRIRMARKLKLTYTQLGYYNKGRMDYQAEDVAKFREQVLKVIVPACAKLREVQAKRIGVDKLKYYDEAYMFADGNPEPKGDMQQMLDWATEMYHELSPETGEFFDFMREHELFDLITRPGKRLGGYCTSLPSYKAPFIFSNFNGTSADVDVLTHEAGHAFQYYTASGIQEYMDNCHSTSEINEIHSMAMEHFTYPWMDKFFGENADKYRYSHLCSALFVLPYMMCVDEFQHRVYENPKARGKEWRAIWREIEKKYMPWRDYDGVEFLEEGGFWMQKQHIFLYPFYYIDYALAQLCAFELYGRMKTDRSQAWEDYMNLCRAGGSKGYFELLKVARLGNPFEEGTVENAVGHVLKEIEENPYSK